MKTTILLATALLLSILTGRAENARYVSVTATTSSHPASIQVLDGETAEIVSSINPGYGNSPSIFPVIIQRDGAIFKGYPPGWITSSGTALPSGTVVVGPATLSVDIWNSDPSLLTVKITPASYDVNKTLILPPGTNQVYITLESSTNLVKWADATNGVYGSPDAARFFRIRMDKAN